MIITALVEKHYVGPEEILLEYEYLVIRRHQIVINLHDRVRYALMIPPKMP